MAEPNGNSHRISLSESLLDAKLEGLAAKLELRIVDRLQAAIDSKANREDVHDLNARVAVLERDAIGQEALREFMDTVWKRVIGGGGLIALLIAALSLYLALRG